ncbi:hypothetical protein LINGRAHAP2_LOCUS26508 [Linum grandiflorum]
MAEQESPDAMDDDDRLFQCFKCGVNPSHLNFLTRSSESKTFSKNGGADRSRRTPWTTSTIGYSSASSASPPRKFLSPKSSIPSRRYFCVSDVASSSGFRFTGDRSNLLRERKMSKSKSKQGNGVLFDASSIYGSCPSPGSAEPRKKIATDATADLRG